MSWLRFGIFLVVFKYQRTFLLTKEESLLLIKALFFKEVWLACLAEFLEGIFGILLEFFLCFFGCFEEFYYQVEEFILGNFLSNFVCLKFTFEDLRVLFEYLHLKIY